MARLRFEFSSHLPPAYASLLWDVFFVQRSRGLSLQAHFPWITRPDDDTRFATLSDGAQLLAGLTLRRCGDATVAIGLVCVHPEHRGQGLSTQLLEAALREADQRGYTATTLWTGKPAVYQAHGFVLRDEALQYQVNDWPAAAATPARAQRWPDTTEAAGRDRGLPAYAHHCLRVGTDRAELLMLLDPLGASLAEWRGEDADVIELLSAVMPARWRLNALQDDSLPEALAARGTPLTVSPQQLQMWRPGPGASWPELPRLRLLDRI